VPQHDEHHIASLIIPISSSTSAKDLFIEIFPEEMAEVASSTLLQILKDEDAALDVWADAALLYLHQKQSRESSIILQAACDRPSGNREERVRILASAGIAYLTQAAQLSSGSAPGSSKRPGAVADPRDELRGLADNRFTNASKVDTLFPMTWMGRGMLNLSVGRLDQARFFFDTTLKQCGPVLPALLGMAAVLYGDKDFKGAQDMYAKAIRLYPEKSGAPTRVGFGLACYQLGQVRR
jgi:RNA polymerase-associated protein CTR9